MMGVMRLQSPRTKADRNTRSGDYNLKAYPECELGGEKFLATEVTDPDEYARLYGLAVQAYAGWGDYRLKTDPIGRRIPVFRLKPR